LECHTNRKKRTNFEAKIDGICQIEKSPKIIYSLHKFSYHFSCPVCVNVKFCWPTGMKMPVYLASSFLRRAR